MINSPDLTERTLRYLDLITECSRDHTLRPHNTRKNINTIGTLKVGGGGEGRGGK